MSPELPLSFVAGVEPEWAFQGRWFFILWAVETA